VQGKEPGARPWIAGRDDYALENLDAALATFNNSYVNFKFIARTEVWDIRAERSGIDRIEHVHYFS
jgi:hypothetical protein